MNTKQTASVVALIAAAYPQWPATPETVAIYGKMLGDLPYELVIDAVQDLISLDDRWPTIAAIRRRCFAQSGQLAPARDVAWDEISRALAAHGSGSPPTFSHPSVDEAVRIIGWRNLCVGDLSVERAHFWKVYDETARRHDVEILVAKVDVLNGGARRALDRGQDEVVAPATTTGRCDHREFPSSRRDG